jgi:hypothetical protein
LIPTNSEIISDSEKILTILKIVRIKWYSIQKRSEFVRTVFTPKAHTRILELKHLILPWQVKRRSIKVQQQLRHVGLHPWRRRRREAESGVIV